MRSMNDAACQIKDQALFEEVREIIGFLQDSFQEERAAHQVEEELWRRVLKLGRYAFGTYLALFGEGDAGDRIVLEGGRAVRRLDALHRREYRSVFGLFELNRVV